MFSRKKDVAKISDKIPVFHVRYIGFTETFVANGRGCSYAPVQRLWDNSPDEKHLRKVALHLSQSGIVMKDAEKKDELIAEFPIANISFCNTDRAVNERIFSWICRDVDENRLDCHAVLCSTKLKAQTMAVVLSRAFQIAYKDWKSHNRNRDHVRTSAALSGPQQNGGVRAGLNGHGLGGKGGGGAGGGGAGRGGGRDTPSPKPRSRRPGMTSPASGSEMSRGSSESPAMTSSSNEATASPPRRPQRSHVTSSKHAHPSTSSGFMHSSILDPDMEDTIRRVENLNPSFDSADSD